MKQLSMQQAARICGGLGVYTEDDAPMIGGSMDFAPSSPAFGGALGPGWTVVTTVGAIGGGVGAAAAINTAGSLGALGSAAPATGVAYATGLLGALAGGAMVGTFLYNNSEAVRETAQNMVERVMTDGPFGAVAKGVSDIVNRNP